MSLDLFRLPRPEYTRQPESLITDLIWGSLPKGLADSQTFLLPWLEKENDGYVGKAGALAAALDQLGSGGLFVDEGDDSRRVLEAVFTALLAPRAPGARLGDALVVVNPDFAAFQNLRGFTNKRQPPSYHSIFDRFAALGGSKSEGEAAASYLSAFATPASASQNAAGFLEAGLSAYAARAFEALRPGKEWRSPSAQPDLGFPPGPGLKLAQWMDETPFAWFWSKWTNLHTQGWRDVLPARRFADWQSCVARTGLAMGYLYEARMLCLLREAVARRAAGSPARDASLAFAEHLGGVRRPVPLGRIYGPGTSPSTKACWPWLENVVRQGLSFLPVARAVSPTLDWEVDAPPATVLEAWLEGLDPKDAQTMVDDAQASPSDGRNLLEFIRHLLKPLEDRGDETGSGERADLYGLLKSGPGKKVWFEPGPEWLVPIVSLEARPQPGGVATLKMVRTDLARLGLECDRSVLVAYLEACGLTTDSPDADDGLIVRSGF